MPISLLSKLIFLTFFQHISNIPLHRVFPHRVDICHKSYGAYCMGVYLKDVWVLTTVYCISMEELTQSSEVVLGNTHQSCVEGYRRRIVNTTTMDQNFREAILIEMIKPFKPFDFKIFNALDRRPMVDVKTETCIVYGYFYRKKNWREPSDLRIFNVELEDGEMCKEYFPSYQYNPLVNMCGRLSFNMEASSSPVLCNRTLYGLVIENAITIVLGFKMEPNLNIQHLKASRRSIDYTGSSNRLEVNRLAYYLLLLLVLNK